MANINLVLKTGTAPYRIDNYRKIPFSDFGDKFLFTIQDSAGTAINLTGITPKFTLYEPSPDHFLLQRLQKDCTITDAVNGKCEYTVVNGDFNRRTIFYGRVELTTGTTKRDSTQDFFLEVL